MNFIRYEESRPEAMRAMLGKAPVAYVPFGALEWHGEHDPLGLDGLKAHALCEAAAELTGGVVFPTVFWGAFDTMPYPFTFHFEKSGIRVLVRGMLKQLESWGFKVIVLLTGHYPPTQISLLKKECRQFNETASAFAIGIPEQMLAIDIGYYGDHAGMWETSLMLAIRPELVDQSAMPKGLPAIERLDKFGVMGRDPNEATAEKGRHVIEHISRKLAALVEKTLNDKNADAIEEVYRAYQKALNIFSPSIFRVAREALDVRSPIELIRIGIWALRHGL